jgi:hypothetical protein
MLHELIAQGNDMIQRLEKHVGQSPQARKSLPDDQQVTIEELVSWEGRIVSCIEQEWDEETLARFRNYSVLYSQELENSKGDEVDRHLNKWRREVSLLEELEKRRRFRNQPDDGGVSVLFIAADPSDESRLSLGTEFREIQGQLESATLRDRFRLELPRLSARSEDVSRALLDTKPSIVHFSGHGSSDGALIFEDSSGRAQKALPAALTDLFGELGDTVECVVLNACFSESQAQGIGRHVPYVIGMTKSVGDRAAIAFSVGFYQAVGAGIDIEGAFRLGKVQIGLQGIDESLTPVLVLNGLTT